MTTDIDLVSSVLGHEKAPLLPSEIARWCGITPGAARRALQQLAKEGGVVKNDNGYYKIFCGGNVSLDNSCCDGGNHRYDDDCNWRSQIERDAHRIIAKGIHNEMTACTHKAFGNTCDDLATAALDALYENGYAITTTVAGEEGDG